MTIHRLATDKDSQLLRTLSSEEFERLSEELTDSTGDNCRPVAMMRLLSHVITGHGSDDDLQAFGEALGVEDAKLLKALLFSVYSRREEAVSVLRPLAQELNIEIWTMDTG